MMQKFMAFVKKKSTSKMFENVSENNDCINIFKVYGNYFSTLIFSFSHQKIYKCLVFYL